MVKVFARPATFFVLIREIYGQKRSHGSETSLPDDRGRLPRSDGWTSQRKVSNICDDEVSLKRAFALKLNSKHFELRLNNCCFYGSA